MRFSGFQVGERRSRRKRLDDGDVCDVCERCRAGSRAEGAGPPSVPQDRGPDDEVLRFFW